VIKEIGDGDGDDLWTEAQTSRTLPSIEKRREGRTSVRLLTSPMFA